MPSYLGIKNFTDTLGLRDLFFHSSHSQNSQLLYVVPMDLTIVPSELLDGKFNL